MKNRTISANLAHVSKKQNKNVKLKKIEGTLFLQNGNKLNKKTKTWKNNTKEPKYVQ